MSRLADRLQSDIDDGRIPSIRAIARKTGVSDATIRGILGGIIPRTPTLDKLARRYFNLPPAEVYRMAGVLPNGRTHDPNRDWLLERIYDMLTRLPTEALAEFLVLAMQRLNEHD
jgi:transcriptional regulator with XRE-family HTH domain